MKIGPLPANGIPGIQLESPIKVTPSEAPVDAQVQKIKDSIKRIKMRTNATTTRIESPVEEAPVVADSAISDSSVQVDAVTEDTKPLSPQLVALAKQRRALQVKERELLDREKAIAERGSQDVNADLIARIKSQPMSVLQEYGVTYDQLTEAILADQSGTNPKILELEAKIKSLEEGVNKNFNDRDTQAETQVKREIAREAEFLAKEGEAYELIREKKAVPKVVDLIHRTWKKEGEILDTSEAMQLVEDELFKEALRDASFSKVKSKLTPAQDQAQTAQKPNTMRTLTNRDSSAVPLSRKERAIMAMNGTLKKG